jgi:predicted glycosyltransferase
LRILVDIGHPAHVHFFKYAIQAWQDRGHTVIITARDKDIALSLLDSYGLDYTLLGTAGTGLISIFGEFLSRIWKFWWIVRDVRPDIMVGIGGTGYSHVGWVRTIPSLVFSDTEHAKLSNSVSYPFATRICTPSCYKGDLGPKHVRYEGYHELAYLHPNRFQPRAATLLEAGIGVDEPFFLVRFVSWRAAHDVGHAGFSEQGRRGLVQCLAELGRVVVTSESPLPPELEVHRIAVPPTRIHDLLYYSSLYVGEGGTMASEAAVLGTPAIYVNSLTMGYIEELQEYGLLHRIVDETQAIRLATSLAQHGNAKQEYQDNRSRLLQDKMDVTAWLSDFVESFAP